MHGLNNLPPEILIVPLAGHTLGHAGIAIETGEGWLLHAGDAYFHHAEMDPDRPSCAPGLAGYQRLMEVNRVARLVNQTRLRALIRNRDARLRLFCAHDPIEFELFRSASSFDRQKHPRVMPEWISDLAPGPDGSHHPEALLDKAIADTFPASDPTTYQAGRTGRLG